VLEWDRTDEMIRILRRVAARLSLNASWRGAETGRSPNEPRFVSWYPAPENAIRAFAGEWSSAVPGYTSGRVPLFEDPRIHWFASQLGGFSGLRVLELGPLEGGHTFMMSQQGATVLAIEANLRAWLRCLAVKELLGTANATFWLGDFREYLKSAPERFDFVLASGVLYHQADPVGMLTDLGRVTDRIGLWTHYFDPPAMRARAPSAQRKFTYRREVARTSAGRTVELFERRYLDELKWSGFCGGLASTSKWMTRQGILDVLGDLRLACEIAFDEPDHPNGPACCIFAARPNGT
jgi:hypothetical protein